MRFINKGESVKIRIGEIKENFYWITLKKGETMELPKDIGKRNNLKEIKATKSKIGSKVVETKQIYTSDGLFLKELTKIKGIGSKTARDIVVWGTKEKLIDAIELRAELPFRDDIELKLREKYGK